MTRKEAIKLAREAGLHPYYDAQSLAIERFAALVAAAEREACAKIVYGLCVSDNNAQEIANAIRARGSK
jgi:hypothetical protein